MKKPLGKRDCQTIQKPRFDLITADAELGLARVLTHGALKYGDRNWEKGLPWSQIVAPLRRHLNAIMQSELIDPDSGLPHVDHVQANAMFLSSMMKRHPDLNDLFPESK